MDVAQVTYEFLIDPTKTLGEGELVKILIQMFILI